MAQRTLVRTLAVALAVWLMARPTPADDANVVLDGLDSPVAMAAEPGGRGGLVIAQAGVPALGYWTEGADRPVELVRQAPDDLAGEGYTPTAVAYLDLKHLFVVWGSADGSPAVLASYNLSGDGKAELASSRMLSIESAQAGGEDQELAGAVRSVCVGERRVYAAVDGETPIIVGARHNSGLLSKFRTVVELDQRAPVCCESPRGYLLAAGAERIEFYDPARSEAGALATFATGGGQPIAVAYGRRPRPAERLLYLAREDGVYRVDAALDASGRPSCELVRVIEARGLRGLAFAHNGALYMIDNVGGGRLLRAGGEF